MHRGFCKLYRKFIEWEWYDDANCVRVYLHLLLTVNHRKKTYRGVEVGQGETLTSFERLSDQTGLSIKQIRGAISKLEGTKYLERKRAGKGAGKGQVISVVNFDTYNGDENEEGTQESREKAGKGQEKGRERASNKNVKNVKNVKNKDLKAKWNRSDAKKLGKNYPWIKPEIWDEYVDYRADVKKKPITERALNGIISKLQGVEIGEHNANASLMQTMDEGWIRVFKLKTNGNTINGNRGDARGRLHQDMVEINNWGRD